MNWLTNFVKPKLSALVGRRKSIPDNLWQNCPSCGNMMHHKELFNNLNVCSSCNYHFRISIDRRIEILFEKENFKEIKLEKLSDDPLKFIDKKKYTDRLKEYRKKTNRNDAFVFGEGIINSKKIIVGFMDFSFMGGSMGREVGKGIVTAAKKALKDKYPFVIFTSSGGARMQEGIISLMQMPKTVAAIELLSKNQVPYIVVLTDPGPPIIAIISP